MARPSRQRIVRDGLRAVGYLRVSTQEQGESGLGLAAQRAAIDADIARRGWQLVEVFEETLSGKVAPAKRPALTAALNALRNGRADVLIVSKLDRLSRSLLDFAGILARADTEGWRVVILDLAVDTTTPTGEVMAFVASAFAQYERRLISDRTKASLQALKARGVRLGRPRVLSDTLRTRISLEREAGRTLAAIAASLEADSIPTAQGGKRWYPATVAKVLQSAPNSADVAA